MPTERELLDELDEIEGGFVDHPNDRGGPTKHGISLRYARTIGDRDGDGQLEFDFDGDGDVDREDIRIMPLSAAEEVFMEDFYRKPKINRLPEPIVRIMFDMAVNHGPSIAVKILQRVINAAGFGPIAVDGIIGPVTIMKAEIAHREMGPFLVNALVDERKNFYRRIVENDPSQSAFIKGWLRRAELFRVPV